MPIYSPTGFLDVTNATLRTSNLEAENFKLNGGNIYVSTDFTVAPTLQLITNGGSVTSNTVEFTNPTTGLVVDSNIVVTGNVTAGYLYGDASNVTAVPAAQITGTLAVANGGTGTTTSTGTGSVVLSDAPTFTGDVTFDTNTLFVDSVNDRVGIGTTSPGASLDVNGGAIFSGGGPVINCTTNNPGDMISKRYASADRYGMGQYAGGVTRLFTSTAYAAGKICLSGATDDVTTANAGFTDYVTIENNGDVGIGTTIPEAVLDVRSGTTIPRLRGDAGRSLFMGSNYTHVNSTGFSETSTNYAWDGYPGVIRMNSSGEYRFHGQTGTYTVVVRADGGFVPFTGLHETYLPFDEDDQGKIVYSTGDYASELKDGNVDGVICDYLTVLDACPVVKICATENDKRVMGVLSTRHRRTQIKEISKEEYELITGDEKYAYEKKEGTDVYIRDIDTDEFSRGYYNAVGEGGIWVCNKNGNLENGDYITSSTVAGYGQKQNDDLLHNYTVAKITTDCDFTEIWVTTKKHKKTREGYLFDENNEPVYENILDTEGNTQNHLKFKLRYLLPDGTQISEEEYTTKTLAGEKVYVAAFVGCTYHCG